MARHPGSRRPRSRCPMSGNPNPTAIRVRPIPGHPHHRRARCTAHYFVARRWRRFRYHDLARWSKHRFRHYHAATAASRGDETTKDSQNQKPRYCQFHIPPVRRPNRTARVIHPCGGRFSLTLSRKPELTRRANAPERRGGWNRQSEVNGSISTCCSCLQTTNS